MATRASLSIYGETVTVDPALVPVLLLAGVTYSVVFSALGGGERTVDAVRQKTRPLLEGTGDRPVEQR